MTVIRVRGQNEAFMVPSKWEVKNRAHLLLQKMFYHFIFLFVFSWVIVNASYKKGFNHAEPVLQESVYQQRAP